MIQSMIEHQRVLRARPFCSDSLSADPVAPPATPALELRDVAVSLAGRSILHDVNLSVAPGESIALIGQSGGGKSVLLRVILGLLRPSSGEVALWGSEVARAPEAEWNVARRRIGCVFQSGALFDSVSVFDNVAFPLREERVPEDQIASIVAERLEWVDLAAHADRFPDELSGGMRRRVAVARTLAARPELILYDEPTTGLDPLTGRSISELIARLAARTGAASILVTHDLQSAQIVAPRWAFLSEGTIVADGPPSLVAGHPHGAAFVDAYGWVGQSSVVRPGPTGGGR